MPAVKAAPASAPPPATKAPSTRVTRSRRPATTTTTAATATTAADADALASQLDRVLKVGQPKAAAPAASSSKLATTAATKRAPAKPTSRTAEPRARTASSSVKKSDSAPPTATSASARRTATRVPASATTTAAKGKSKAAAVPEPALKYPWSVPGDMPARDRALAAQAAVKEAGQILGDALKKGFKYGVSKTETAAAVDEAVCSGSAGLGVVRELFCGPAAKGSQGVGIEKAALNLALQCLLLDMNKQALDVLVESKPWVLKLYPHDNLEEVPQSAVPKGKKPAPDFSRLAVFPAPAGDVDESVRVIVCSFSLSAWCCLLALGKVDPASVQTLIPFPSPDSDPFNPVNLAPSLPPSSISSLAVLICRRVSSLAVTPGSAEWFHVRRVSAFLLAICVSRNQAKPNLPDKIWDSVGRTTQVYLQERNDDAARREIAAFIDRTVDIVETIAKTRNEQRGEWFTGSWPEVADMWIGIGRTLGDSAIIDKALTCMTAGITIRSSSIVSSVSSRSSGASTPTSTLDVPPTPKSAKASHRAIADLSCCSARLAKALVEVEALFKQDQPTSKALEEVLAPTDVASILEPLCALEDSPANLPAATSAIRAVERLRRSVIKLLDRPTAMSAARQWLEEVFNVVEAILTRVKAPSLVQSVARDGLPGLVDSTSSLLRICDVTASGQSAIDLIDRAYAIWEACSEHFETASRVQYGAFLIQSAHGVAHRFSRANMYPESRDLCKRACDWTIALRGIFPSDPEEMAKLKSWEAAESALPRRFELLGFSLASDQLNDKAKAIEAYVLGLVNLPKATVHKIDGGANSQSLSTTFTDLADAAALFKRISTLLTGEEAVEGNISAIVKAAMVSRQQSVSFRGAIIEQLVDTIDHAQFRPHVQETIVALCDLLLEMYDSVYPIRRMRVLLRLMNLVVSTGAVADRFSPFAEEVTSLASKDPANDVQLKPFKFEYQSSALILAALNKYHDEVEPSAAVATLGGEAIEVIRAVVLPPINEAEFPAATGKRPVSSTQRRGAVKTPPSRPAPTGRTRVASKPTLPARRGTVSKSDAKTAVTPTALVIDNANRFSQLLGSLASLFGLLGLVLPRLETLKVLRAVLRTCDGMSDALVHTSGLLASEYARLGKFSRAAQVFVQALKQTAEAKSPVSAGTRADFRLRHARFLASTGHIQQAKDEYREAERLMKEIPKSSGGTLTARYVELCATSERIALAHGAMAAIRMAESDVTTAIESLNIAYRLWCRAAAGISRIAASASDTTEVAPPVEAESPAASTDSKKQAKQPFCLTGKHLGGLQWYYALGVFEATLELVVALAQRGTVKESEYYLGQAKGMVPAIRSTALDARVSAQTAALEARKAKFESSADNLRHASEVLAVNDGPDAIELKRLRGELYSRQQAAPEAEEFFSKAIDALTNLDEEFKTAEAHTTSPKKETKSPIKEPLLPRALGGILRQRAWILREAGEVEEYQNVMQQLELVSKAAGEKPEQMFLDARVAMSEAFNHFKTDLFMSSLTESTIAMTMVTPDKRAKDRQSTRHGANVLLERAVEAFRATLASDGHIGRVEHVRQACVSLAVLGAYQTSLGQGSPAITSMAADILASVSSITLQRELLPAIKSKFPGSSPDDLDWPSLEPVTVPVAADATSTFWKSLAAKEVGSAFLDTQHDLSSVPPTWSVVSITVTDDRNTMLVSRHQNGFDPLVFCIPLDRQGRREGEEESELFTFDAGINEMKAIMDGNDASIKSISECKTMEDRKAWWKERYALDTRLGELLATIEFCWLGAFKTVLNPRPIIDAAAFAAFRDRLDLIFQTALSSAGSDTRRGARVRLNDTLLTCFATLSSKCKDEEVEDLVYFVLDQYQFHGIAVALAELDFDQIGVDVKSALADLEAAAGDMSASKKEHLLLALDKNVQGIPWESLPILRGRAVSRIPSLPFLLDQVALGLHLGQPADKRTLDATKTTFFMNPGGDLTGTEGRFKDALDALEKKGWKGLRGRAPSEAEMEAALKESELVMYFGHGGGEEYIRGYKVRALPRCAVTMLWGCSSGLLRDHGDFDRTGTPYDYVLAGSPCLVANLWDVTDKDIDRVTVQVMDLLGLDAMKLGEARGEPMSVVQAVSAARSVAKLQFLTGAATVVYGIPVYIQ